MNDQIASIEVVNMNEFQRVLNKYLAVCSRELPQALNYKMFFIARGASQRSPKASRPEIEKELGVVGYKVKVGKRGKALTRNGKVRWVTQVSNKATIAPLVINARLGRAGKRGLFGAEMRQAVARLISKRIRAIGTIKAGWWSAIRGFGAAVGESSVKEVNTNRVKGGAKFKIARDGFTPRAELEYLVNSFTQQHEAYIDIRTRDALARSYADEMRSMDEYVIKRLQKHADRLST